MKSRHVGSSHYLRKSRLFTKRASLDDGYEIIRNNIGRGKYSKVHLVRRKKDGKLFAWKTPTKSTRDKHYYPFTKHSYLHKIWVYTGLTQTEMFLSHDKQSIFHEYIAGHTLCNCLKHYPGFLTDLKHPMTKSLDILVTRMLSHAVFFKGLHTRNIMYDGRQWQIIDSQSPKSFDSPRRAWDKMYTLLYLGEHWGFGKWRIPYNPLQWRDLKYYMEHIEHDLLPAIEATYAGPSPPVHALIREFRAHVRSKKRRPSEKPGNPILSLRELAAAVKLSRYPKHRRGPKKKPPERSAYQNGNHVSTAKLIAPR